MKQFAGPHEHMYKAVSSSMGRVGLVRCNVASGLVRLVVRKGRLITLSYARAARSTLSFLLHPGLSVIRDSPCLRDWVSRNRQKGYFMQKAPILVILNAVKDLYKTQPMGVSETVAINDRFLTCVRNDISRVF